MSTGRPVIFQSPVTPKVDTLITAAFFSPPLLPARKHTAAGKADDAGVVSVFGGEIGHGHVEIFQNKGQQALVI